jgi:hypothetical protein
MIVLVASTYDSRAQFVARHWGSDRARLLTAEDSSASGWTYGGPQTLSTAVVSGQRIHADEISGILTLRPCIYSAELQHIRSSDRDYVASELNAFLLAWLTSQSCRVMNRPTPLCLAGPNWAPIQWTHAAARVSIPDVESKTCASGWRRLTVLPLFAGGTLLCFSAHLA